MLLELSVRQPFTVQQTTALNALLLKIVPLVMILTL